MNSASSFRRLLFEQRLRLIDPGSYSAFQQLMASQSLSRDELMQLNWHRRKLLVDHCARNIPFYKAKFKDAGFEAGDLKSELDWAQLPILEKSDVRSQSEAIVNPKYRLSNLPPSTTGGTTGAPLKTYNDPTVHLSSMSWRMLRWWDLHPGDNSGYLYRAIPTGLRRRLGDIALYPSQRAYIAANAMSPENMRVFYQALRAARPAYLVGYVGALEVFARYCEEANLRLPSLRAIWTTASPLSPNCRSVLEQVFQCPAYTQYGSCEFYWIAAECRHKNGLHVGADIRQVDVDTGSTRDSGGFGDLIVTDLLNYAFPLLRYRIGDRGRMISGGCACGLSLPLMDYVRGRVTDSIRLRNGRIIPGEYWTTIFDDFTAVISAFQVRQKSDLSIDILYVGRDPADARKASALVLRRLDEQTEGQAQIDMIEVNEIPHRDGKVQFVVSEAAPT